MNQGKGLKLGTSKKINGIIISGRVKLDDLSRWRQLPEEKGAEYATPKLALWNLPALLTNVFFNSFKCIRRNSADGTSGQYVLHCLIRYILYRHVPHCFCHHP